MGSVALHNKHLGYVFLKWWWLQHHHPQHLFLFRDPLHHQQKKSLSPSRQRQGTAVVAPSLPGSASKGLPSPPHSRFRGPLSLCTQQHHQQQQESVWSSSAQIFASPRLQVHQRLPSRRWEPAQPAAVAGRSDSRQTAARTVDNLLLCEQHQAQWPTSSSCWALTAMTWRMPCLRRSCRWVLGSQLWVRMWPKKVVGGGVD